MTKENAAEKPSEFTQPNRQRQAQMPPQTMKCFVVPIDMMDAIRDCVKEAPFKEANQVLGMLSTLQIMDIPVGRPDQMQ